MEEITDKFLSKAGQLYLSAGGPTSRFEEMVEELGQSLSLPMETFILSTGVFTSVERKRLSITRVKTSRTCISVLIEVEKIFEDLNYRIIDLEEACERIEKIDEKGFKENRYVLLTALFLTGFSASYPQFLSWPAAIISGLLTILISWLSGPVARKWRVGSIFGEFFASFTNYVLAACFGYIFNFSIPAMVIGGLILVVPGITLTNAISELAEQHMISGTAKLMRGLLTILALGASYFLFSDFVKLFGLSFMNQLPKFTLGTSSFEVQMAFFVMLIFAFCNIFSVPLRHTPFALLTGVVGWGALKFFNQQEFVILGSFAPAFMVGVLSLLLSRMTQVPSQTYSVPGILSLVPGMLALLSFSGGIDGSGAQQSLAYQVAVIASGIVFGLLSARIPMLLYRKKSAVDTN